MPSASPRRLAGLSDALRIERVPGFLPHQGQKADQFGVVVQHLLEMRHQPARIGGVARIAAAEMIVDAALADRRQGAQDGVAIGLEARAFPGAPQQFEDPGLGKFGRGTDAAVERVDLAHRRAAAARN